MCVCVCAGVLMVDMLGHQGIPLKGQLYIRTEFEKKTDNREDTERDVDG